MADTKHEKRKIQEIWERINFFDLLISTLLTYFLDKVLNPIWAIWEKIQEGDNVLEIVKSIDHLCLVLIYVFAFFYFSSRWIVAGFNLLDKTSQKKVKMPKLEPVPIPTERHGIMAWMHSVRKWRLTEHWKYDLPESCCIGCGKIKIIIPKGFEFDGASIPRPLWAVLHPSGLLLIQALVHDFAYRRGFLWKLVIDEKTGEETGEVCRCNGNKKDWDMLFKKIGADVNGVRTVNFVVYWAVRLFGFFAWKKNQKHRGKPVEAPEDYTEIADDSEEG